MTVQQVVLAERSYRVRARAMRPTAVSSGRRRRAPAGRLRCATSPGLALLCNDASLRAGQRGGTGWSVTGDPTEGALLTLARKAGLDLDALAAQQPRLDAIPFESEHRYMATLHARATRRRHVVFVKGAPEAVFAMCARSDDRAGGQAFDAAAWHARIDAQAPRASACWRWRRHVLPSGHARPGAWRRAAAG